MEHEETRPIDAARRGGEQSRTPLDLRREVEQAWSRLADAREGRPPPEINEGRRTHVILEWNRLVIAGTFERRPNERVVTTIARVVPNVGATVKIRMPGYEGRMNGGQDLWTVIEIRAAADGASRLLRLRRVPVL